MTKINLQDIGEILQEKARTVSECLGVTKGTGCSATEYEDIIYVTSQKKFWLLPKELADRLSESASLLADKVATDDKMARMQNLETSGLIHCIATPKLESFLSEEEREKYLDADWLIDDIAKGRVRQAITMAYYTAVFNNNQHKNIAYTVDEKCHPETKQYAQNLYQELQQKKYGNQDYMPDVNWKVRDFERKYESYEDTWNELDKKARAALKAAGYEMRDGVIFTPEQIQIKKAIDNYLKNQKKLQSHENTSEDNNKNIFEAIAEYRKKVETLYLDTTQYPMLAATMGDGLLIQQAFEAFDRGTIDELEKTIKNQMECIIELANYGIAVPEFALGSKDPEHGLKQLHYLRSLQVRRQNAASALEKKFEIWYNATGRNIVPPLPIFDNDIEKIAVIDAEIDEIQAKAEQVANNNTPPMLLFWDPKKFEPKEAEWLVKGNMPLREFSKILPNKGGPFLSHISLYDLVSKNTALFDMLNKGSSHIKSLNNDDGLFDVYLTENMAYEIGFQKDWYDHEKATFKAQTFFDYLDNKGWKIKSIETQAQRDEWAKTLNSIIFEEKVQRHIMAFDNSLSASFIRLLGGPKMAQLNYEVKGPEMENLKFGSIQFNLKISPLHGQVDIFDFTYPKPNQAIQISIPYYTYRGERKELDFGHFYLRMRAKAWGFAGVSLMGVAKVALSDDLGVVGIKVVDSATGKESGRTGTGAILNFNLFAGVQAGIKLITELMWCRPANLKNFNTVYEQAIARKTQQPIPTFRTLSKVEVGAAVQAGGALAGGVGIILKDGKLHIAFELSAAWGVGGKVFTSFEVDYRSIGDLVQIVCKALIDNDMEPLQWVEDDALDAIIKMSVLGIALPTLTYWTFWTVTQLDKLYRSIIAEGKGGIVAYYIVRREYRDYFKDWFMVLPPQAVGPLLWTLTRSSGAFEVADDPTQQPVKYTREHSVVYQQQAINLCLSWIKERAEGAFSKTNPNNAQKFFEAAVCRMNADGVIDLNENARNNNYMYNRFECLETTMRWLVRDERLVFQSDDAKLTFKSLVRDLGIHIDCYVHDAGEEVYLYPGARRYTYNKRANN